MIAVLQDCQNHGTPKCISFSDVFSARPDDFGYTDLVKHHSNTGQSALSPIQRPPRRYSLAKREEAERAVQEM